LPPIRIEAKQLEFWGVSGNCVSSRVSCERVSGAAPSRRNASPLRANVSGLIAFMGGNS
jgi:hypothetical protein